MIISSQIIMVIIYTLACLIIFILPTYYKRELMKMNKVIHEKNLEIINYKFSYEKELEQNKYNKKRYEIDLERLKMEIKQNQELMESYRSDLDEIYLISVNQEIVLKNLKLASLN